MKRGVCSDIHYKMYGRFMQDMDCVRNRVHHVCSIVVKSLSEPMEVRRSEACYARIFYSMGHSTLESAIVVIDSPETLFDAHIEQRLPNTSHEIMSPYGYTRWISYLTNRSPYKDMFRGQWKIAKTHFEMFTPVPIAKKHTKHNDRFINGAFQLLRMPREFPNNGKLWQDLVFRGVNEDFATLVAYSCGDFGGAGGGHYRDKLLTLKFPGCVSNKNHAPGLDVFDPDRDSTTRAYNYMTNSPLNSPERTDNTFLLNKPLPAGLKGAMDSFRENVIRESSVVRERVVFGGTKKVKVIDYDLFVKSVVKHWKSVYKFVNKKVK